MVTMYTMEMVVMVVRMVVMVMAMAYCFLPL